MASKRSKSFIDVLGRNWPSVLGDVAVDSVVWLGDRFVKILELDPEIGPASVVYQWTTGTGEVKTHKGLPPICVGHAWHSEKGVKYVRKLS